MPCNMAGIASSLGGLDAYVENANNVITFKLIRKREDLDDESLDFYPEYSHQIFGNSELIFGYTGLKIGIYYTASRLLPYFTMSYKNMYNKHKKDDIGADDVHKIITEKLEISLPTNIDEFAASLDKEVSFRPCGKMIKSFQLEDDDSAYEVYRSDISVPGFRDYHNRMQTFVLWFIDAASFIDDDDDKWEYFQLFQRVVENGDPRYYFVGYATVYRYYAFPAKVRPRISQMLVLPPFQKRGLGAEFLQSMYDWYICDSDVLDITVEDPSEEFIRLRDFVDCKNCMRLRSFEKEALLKGFSADMCKEAQEKFKLCKRQSRRVYEILRLRITNTSSKKEYREFRLLVKQRLNAPFQRQKLDMEKIKHSLTAEELAATKMPTEQRIEQLEHSYKELEEEYKKVIERLAVI